MEELNKQIIGLVEDIIRGRPTDVETVSAQSKNFFKQCSRGGNFSTSTKSDLFKFAVNLHNKLRVLPPQTSEAKGYLRGSSAFLILTSCESTPQAVW